MLFYAAAAARSTIQYNVGWTDACRSRAELISAVHRIRPNTHHNDVLWCRVYTDTDRSDDHMKTRSHPAAPPAHSHTLYTHIPPWNKGVYSSLW